MPTLPEEAGTESEQSTHVETDSKIISPTTDRHPYEPIVPDTPIQLHFDLKGRQLPTSYSSSPLASSKDAGVNFLIDPESLTSMHDPSRNPVDSVKFDAMPDFVSLKPISYVTAASLPVTSFGDNSLDIPVANLQTSSYAEVNQVGPEILVDSDSRSSLHEFSENESSDFTEPVPVTQVVEKSVPPSIKSKVDSPKVAASVTPEVQVTGEQFEIFFWICVVLFLTYKITRATLRRRCPSCKHLFSGLHMGEVPISRRGYSLPDTQRKTIKNGQGQTIRIEEKEVKSYHQIVTYRVYRECKHCGYEWSYTIRKNE